MDKERITRDFSRAAWQYEQYAWLPQEVGRRLLGFLESSQKPPQRILDIGCGTGALSAVLTRKFPSAQITGFDLSAGMLKVAGKRAPRKDKLFLQADLEFMPFKPQSFELIISNLVYQRISDLKGAFKKANRILIAGGKFYLSLTTAGTLKELQQSFIAAAKRVLRVCPQEDYRHPQESRITAALKSAGFRIIKFKHYHKKRSYRSSRELIQWLKSIGASHHYQQWIKGLEGRRVLKEMERQYKIRFARKGWLPATFRAVIVVAEKI
ncbi:MAG: methyltransferase domain-containing protein [Candidatus Omnitrophota bacterium]